MTPPSSSTSAAGSIPDLHEAIAARVPDRPCILWRDRRLSWADVTDRSRRFAHALLTRGLGGNVDATSGPGWESPHDHVALLLTNGNEYLEAMLGCWKARAAAINLNYRYTAEELRYVLVDSGARAIVFHRRFADLVAEATHGLTVDCLVVVDDGSAAGADPHRHALDYEALLAESAHDRPALDWSPADRYVVYTGGTTGSPKGVLWRQDDFLHTALGLRGTRVELLSRAERTGRPHALPAPPFMHGAAHWNALSCWLAGGTVVIQDRPDRLDAADVLDTCARHEVTSLLIVGDAFARPLVDELRRSERALPSLRTLMTGGAILSPSVKQDLVTLLPHLRVVDILGSSETGRHGVASAGAADEIAAPAFRRSDTTVVLDAERSRELRPGDPEVGWLAQRGRVPLGYLGDQDKTEATFPTIGGVVHAVAGDRARLRADETIELLGRDSVTINTGGEKVHAEEVEQALKRDARVYDALVVGRPSDRWGNEIVAVISLAAGASTPDVDTLRQGLDEHLARYKHPRALLVVDAIARSASGKPDYAWARRLVTEG